MKTRFVILAIVLALVAPSIAQTPSVADGIAELDRQITLLIKIRSMEQQNVVELVDMSQELADLKDPKVADILERHLRKVQAAEKEIFRLEKLMGKVPCAADGKCS